MSKVPVDDSKKKNTVANPQSATNQSGPNANSQPKKENNDGKELPKEQSNFYKAVKDKLDKLTESPASRTTNAVLPDHNAQNNVAVTALEALAPGLGQIAMLSKGLGFDPANGVKKTADFAWNKSKALFKGVRNKALGRDWGENNPHSFMAGFTRGGGAKKLNSKSTNEGAKVNSTAQLHKTVKKGFKDVLKAINGKGGAPEEKKKSKIWALLLGIIGFLKSALLGIGSFLLRSLLGRGLTNLLTRGLMSGLTKGLGGLLNKLTGNIFKRGLLRAIPRLGAKLFGMPGARVASRLLPAAGIGLAAGMGANWLAKKLGANENQAKGWGKVAGTTAAGAKIGAAFGPWGAAIGAGVGALVGGLWHGASELKRVNQEYRNAGKALKQYTLEEIKAGKAVGDKNVPQVSNGAWSRALGWLGSRFSKESRENYRKVEAQRVAQNEAAKKKFENAKYGSIADLDKDSEALKATLSNTGWFSKSGKQARDAALKAMSGSVLDYIDKAEDKDAAMKEMKEKYGLSSSDIKNMRDPNRDKSAFAGEGLLKAIVPGYAAVKTLSGIKKDDIAGVAKKTPMYKAFSGLKKWFTKQTKKEDKETEETTKNTDALTKLTEILEQMTNPDGLESSKQRGNPQMSPVNPQTQAPVVVNNSIPQQSSPIPLAGITQ